MESQIFGTEQCISSMQLKSNPRTTESIWKIININDDQEKLSINKKSHKRRKIKVGQKNKILNTLSVSFVNN